TAHCHGHKIFNSVKYLNGKKIRYEKGDWAEKMQPVTNRLCEKYGFSSININSVNIKDGNSKVPVNNKKQTLYNERDLQILNFKKSIIPGLHEEKIIESAGLKGIQKTCYTRLCYIQSLSSSTYKPYRKHKQIQELKECYSQYMFLVENNINSLKELYETINRLEENLGAYKEERKKLYRDKKQYNSIFSITGQMEELLPAQKSFLAGDSFFEREHLEYQELENILNGKGFTFGEAKRLQEEFLARLKTISGKCRAVYKNLGMAEGIIKLSRETIKTDREGQETVKTGKQPVKHGRLKGGRYGR
ncbi:MAG: hypothetical protein K1W06_03275, partial [Lachnospiraceae bacterium]